MHCFDITETKEICTHPNRKMADFGHCSWLRHIFFSYWFCTGIPNSVFCQIIGKYNYNPNLVWFDKIQKHISRCAEEWQFYRTLNTRRISLQKLHNMFLKLLGNAGLFLSSLLSESLWLNFISSISACEFLTTINNATFWEVVASLYLEAPDKDPRKPLRTSRVRGRKEGFLYRHVL